MAIITDRKHLINSLPTPKTKTEILSFLGLAGYFRAWIPNLSLLARPLYDMAKGPQNEPLLSTAGRPFQMPKQVLLQALALHLPNLSKPFLLYVHEKGGQGLGVLGQEYGPTFAPVAYFMNS